MQDRNEGHGDKGTAPLNRGKLIGPKPPLKPKEIWSIRVRLQVAQRTRDLALLIWRSTASCAPVTWSRSGSMMWP
jgi:hypothetical protein